MGAAAAAGSSIRARGFLELAIDAYAKGFEADWRDAYPGLNAVELMELRDPPDPRRSALLPVVRYAVERRLHGSPDYWDDATLVEIAVLQHDVEGAGEALERALAANVEPWQAASTRDSIRRIRLARERQGIADPSELAHAREEGCAQNPDTGRRRMLYRWARPKRRPAGCG